MQHTSRKEAVGQCSACWFMTGPESVRRAHGDMVWARSRAGKAQAGEGKVCPSITCPVEHGQHDGGDPGCVTVAHVEIFHELLEVDTDGFWEGIGEAGDHKAAEEHDPAPATIRGLHGSWEPSFLWVISPHRLAWEGKGRPGGGRATERERDRNLQALQEEKSRAGKCLLQGFSPCPPSPSSESLTGGPHHLSAPSSYQVRQNCFRLRGQATAGQRWEASPELGAAPQLHNPWSDAAEQGHSSQVRLEGCI